MKNYFYKIGSYLVIVVFLSYWLIVFILSAPSNPVRESIVRNMPLVNKLAGNSWGLFAPPHTYNDKMYLILREITDHSKMDTIEVLGNISLQKQRMAPFNQGENIDDHLLNHYVTLIKKNVWGHRKIIKAAIHDSTEKFYTTAAIDSAINDVDIYGPLATVNNYCSKLMFKNNLDVKNKEFKISITAESIKPFAERNNSAYKPQETFYFETRYAPVQTQ